MLIENFSEAPVVRRDLTFEEFTCTPTAGADLGPQDVHLWTTALSSFVDSISQLYYVLSSEERERASSFRFSCDQQQYIVGHAIRRRILAQYLRIPPSQIEICKGPFGKPQLRSGCEEFSFNDSRCRDLAICAITRGRPVGIDVEYVRPLPQLTEIAGEYFSQHEIEALTSSAEQCRPQQFFTMWCGKEAVLKCTGEGIGSNLNAVDTHLTPPERTGMLYPGKAMRLKAVWDLHSYCPAANHVAVVATNETNLFFSQRTINPVINAYTGADQQA